MQKRKSFFNLKSVFIPLIIFLAVFGTYVHNLSLSVFGGDVGDFVSAIVTHGVPHPSGYPLFTMLGILANSLPFNMTAAWKVGLVSVLAASFSLIFLYIITLLLTKNKMIAIITSLYMAFFSLFWLYAEIAEVFSLTILFILLLFLFSILFYKTKKTLYLYVVSFFAGLSLSHHEIILAIFPSVAILVFSANWRIIKSPLLIAKCLGLFLLGLLPYLYIPIAASLHPLVNWDQAYTLQNFIHLVTRGDYGWQPTSGTISISFKFLAVLSYFEKMFIELTPAGSFLILLGMFQTLRKKQFALFSALFLGFFLTGPFYVWYGFVPLLSGFVMGVIERFYLISSAFLFVFFGFGLELFSTLLSSIIPTDNKKRRGIYKQIIIVIFLILPIALFNINFSKIDLHAVWVGDNLGTDILQPLPKNSVLAIEGDTAFFNTEYMQIARNVRRDITLTNVISLNDHKNIMQDIAKTTGGKDVPTDIKFLIALESFSKSRPVFATTQFQFRDNLYPHINWIPYGILFKIADKQEMQLTEPQFISLQENLFKQMHLPASFSKTAMAFHNLTISDIPAVYAQGYVNIGDYLLSHYGDVSLAKIYYLRSIDTYPFLASAYTGMGYINLSENDCKAAENQFLQSKQIDPTKKAPYMALYLTYANCLRDPQKAQGIANSFSKIFSESILTAIRLGVK